MSLSTRSLFLFLLIVSFSQTACRHPPRQVSRAVYYWKNSDSFGYDEKKLLKKLAIQRVYAKLMDIDWHDVHGAYPITINRIESKVADIYPGDSVNVVITPVVFITNKTFTRIDSSDIPLLATRVLRKCFTGYDSVDIAAENDGTWYASGPVNFRPAEIQFDCDWTASTAAKYFYFLETVRKLLPSDSTKLSATIRLHQYKYPGKTGVPPVDKGMLMVYNISDLTRYSPDNSIFEYDLAKKYFQSAKDYPLPLDIALAAYSWGIVYRNKQFFMIENGMTAGALEDKNFFQPISKNFYSIQKDTLLNDVFLRPGDEIKIETIDEETLLQAAKLARKALNNDTLTVSLFDLSSQPIKQYRHETIEQVYNSFR